MSRVRAALVQMTSSDSPDENLATLRRMVDEAADGGAGFVLTPEVSNCLSTSRAHQARVLRHEEEDETLAAMRDLARERGLWLLLGSFGILTHDGDGRFANRSYLLGPDGAIAAHYDKIHMFDVEVSAEETYRESDGYRPGDSAVLAHTPFARVGMSICYDLRFPHLYRSLAQRGAEILTVPAGFSFETGRAHWEPLLRARAIENGAYVLAPAQCGVHEASEGKQRRTHGHSLAISPWGEVLADGGDAPGLVFVDLDMAEVSRARRRVPSLSHDRDFGDR